MVFKQILFLDLIFLFYIYEVLLVCISVYHSACGACGGQKRASSAAIGVMVLNHLVDAENRTWSLQEQDILFNCWYIFSAPDI